MPSGALLLEAVVNQRGHRVGVLGRGVHQQFVVQAQHDLGRQRGARGPAP